MLLNITCEGKEAPNLSYLLHKHPARVNSFPLSFGRALVFFPFLSDTRATASLLLDVDPLILAREKAGAPDLGDYVSPRPYSSSSFMSVAIARVYSSALGARCEAMPGLAAKELDLTATVAALPCHADKGLLNRVFEPLGYEVRYATSLLDEAFPAWGDGPYVDLVISGRSTLSAFLRHLYVLIPLFDNRKHYWVGYDEVDKLLRHGEGWLDGHPEKGIIVDRYLSSLRHLSRLALGRLGRRQGLASREGYPLGWELDGDAVSAPRAPSLGRRRAMAVLGELAGAGAGSVLDLGCGEGSLLLRLSREARVTRLVGLDVSAGALLKAGERLRCFHGRMPERVTLLQGSALYQDDRLSNFDAAVAVELIEHIQERDLPLFAELLFGVIAPGTVIVTTPNREYNANYGLHDGLRHRGHFFEFDREGFAAWCRGVSLAHGYGVRLGGIGEDDPLSGPPTQMGVFRKC
jgi:3' terminal RNA ribose 2'-O-methyltransferase Hen1